MKIYRKIVLNFDGDVLEEDSYEYNGPIVECKGSNYNSQFQSQTTNAYSQVQQQSNFLNDFSTKIEGMLEERFGRQSKTFDLLAPQLERAVAQGPADYKFKDRGAGGTGGGDGGGSGGGRGGRRGRSGKSRWDYGYNPGIFDIPEWDRLETVMRTESSEDVTNRFQDAAKAFGERSLQLGDYAPGLESAALSDLYETQAGQEATGQRDVLKFIESGKIDYSKLLNQLKEDMYTKAAAIREQEKASKRAAATARGIAAAGRAQASQQFNEQMRLNYKMAQDDQYFRGLGVAGQVAGLQDPTAYAQIGGTTRLGAGNIWSDMYGTGATGIANTKSGSWLAKIAGVAGGIGAMFVPGLQPLGPALIGASTKY